MPDRKRSYTHLHTNRAGQVEEYRTELGGSELENLRRRLALILADYEADRITGEGLADVLRVLLGENTTKENTDDA